MRRTTGERRVISNKITGIQWQAYVESDELVAQAGARPREEACVEQAPFGTHLAELAQVVRRLRSHRPNGIVQSSPTRQQMCPITFLYTTLQLHRTHVHTLQSLDYRIPPPKFLSFKSLSVKGGEIMYRITIDRVLGYLLRNRI